MNRPLAALVALAALAVPAVAQEDPLGPRGDVAGEIRALRREVMELRAVAGRRAAVVLPAAVGCSADGPAPGERTCDPDILAHEVCEAIGYPKAKRISLADAASPTGEHARILENVACHD